MSFPNTSVGQMYPHRGFTGPFLKFAINNPLVIEPGQEPVLGYFSGEVPVCLVCPLVIRPPYLAQKA